MLTNKKLISNTPEMLSYHKKVKLNYDSLFLRFSEQFEFHKKVIVEEITRVDPSVSIYLAGSFARNEGTLKFIDNKPVPLRDYDVLVVTKSQPISNKNIDNIRIHIHNRLGLADPFSRDFKYGGFTVWITQTSLKSINAFPLLKYFELKNSSILLAGDDIRSQISMDFKELSPYNGVLILFSKIEGLLGLLNIADLKAKNSENIIDFFYECLKSYVEMGTSLSLLIGEYNSSFLARNTNIYNKFAQFPELNRLDGLGARIITSTYERLLIDNNVLGDVDFGALLEITIQDLKSVIWYYLTQQYKIKLAEPKNTALIFDEYLSKLNNRILNELFTFYLNKKLHVPGDSKIISKITVTLFLRYSTFKFYFACKKKGLPIKTSILLMRKNNFMLRLWLIGLLILESVDEQLNINEEALNIAEQKLNTIINLPEYLNKSKDFNGESKFVRLKKTESTLLDLADKIFHRKSSGEV
jgi:hypothetical protein